MFPGSAYVMRDTCSGFYVAINSRTTYYLGRLAHLVDVWIKCFECVECPLRMVAFEGTVHHPKGNVITTGAVVLNETLGFGVGNGRALTFIRP